MKYFNYLLLVELCFFTTISASGQAWVDVQGARLSGMNYTSVAIQDFWNINSNPAGIAYLEKPGLGLNYSNRFSMKEMSTKSLAILWPVQWGVLAANVNYFGNSLYHETKAELVYARKLWSNFTAGIQLDYLNVAFGEGYGKNGRVTFGIGVQYVVLKDLTLGVYVYNPLDIRYDTLQSLDIPFLFRAGLAYNFSDQVLASLETERNIFLSYWNLRAGFEYKPDNHFAFRTGVGLYQETFSFGAGYKWRNFNFDIGSTFHQQLGLSSQFSVIYTFQQ
ncbi:MAG: hypothetical protein JXR65_05320 [Bacteroidales bacterium]|nr:hypothetical protein [Bacteroidales bacterium]